MAKGSWTVAKPMRMLARRLVRPGGGRFRSVREYCTCARSNRGVQSFCVVLHGSSYCLTGIDAGSPQLRCNLWTMTMVAAMLVVPRSTLASAVLLTEREIERAPDPRGRPHALSDRQVLDRLHAVCTPCVAWWFE